MTASVGVGGAKNKQAAEKHLLQLAASLDAQKISVVRQNEADLLYYANEPREGIGHLTVSIDLRFISTNRQTMLLHHNN